MQLRALGNDLKSLVRGETTYNSLKRQSGRVKTEPAHVKACWPAEHSAGNVESQYQRIGLKSHAQINHWFL